MLERKSNLKQSKLETHLQLSSDSVSSVDVLREDGRSKTVDRVVGGFNNLVLVLELCHDDDWTEDLLLDDLHVGGDVSEDCLKSARGFTRKLVVGSEVEIAILTGSMK